MTNPTIPVYFKWLTVEADPRQYKPSKPILEAVNLVVEVNVPLTHEYIANSDTIISNQIMNLKNVHPILTPKGMKFCANELETAMKDSYQLEETDDTDWAEEKTEEADDDFIEDQKDQIPY